MPESLCVQDLVTSIGIPEEQILFTPSTHLDIFKGRMIHVFEYCLYLQYTYLASIPFLILL